MLVGTLSKSDKFLSISQTTLVYTLIVATQLFEFEKFVFYRGNGKLPILPFFCSVLRSIIHAQNVGVPILGY
jgi:hypothetical protein